MTAITMPHSVVRPGDVVRLGGGGLLRRPARTLLTALGIAIGIAALVAVVGISASSRAELLAQLDRLGTNLLQVSPGQTFFGDDAVLPDDAPAMIRRVGPVADATATGSVGRTTVRRTDWIPTAETGGIGVTAAELGLLDTVGGTVREGRFLDAATERAPAAVLGASAARRLGIASLRGSPLVWIGDRWFTIIGLLDPVPLLPNLDSAAIVGFPAADTYLDDDGKITTIYLRTTPDAIDAVRRVLPATANPNAPTEVSVSRPSDALAARAAVDRGLTALLLALGGVALLVGGIGIANVMVISVLERRSEIGVRRALGATRRHIRLQFLTEAAILAVLGGLGGVVLGTVVTIGYARLRRVPVAVPPAAIAAGVAAAIVVGIIAGSIPAGRAARLAPADALRPA